jgi:hypothetical protein
MVAEAVVLGGNRQGVMRGRGAPAVSGAEGGGAPGWPNAEAQWWLGGGGPNGGKGEWAGEGGRRGGPWLG